MPVFNQQATGIEIGASAIGYFPQETVTAATYAADANNARVVKLAGFDASIDTQLKAYSLLKGAYTANDRVVAEIIDVKFVSVGNIIIYLDLVYGSGAAFAYIKKQSALPSWVCTIKAPSTNSGNVTINGSLPLYPGATTTFEGKNQLRPICIDVPASSKCSVSNAKF